MSSNANPSSFLRSREPIDIATLYSPDGISPVKRTLQIHLRNLYCSLFPIAGAAEIALRNMGISYCYKINELLETPIPLLLAPHFTVCVTATAPGTTLEEFCKQQADACEAFMATERPPTAHARLRFAFTLMSGTRETDKPLLEADDVYVSLDDISAAS
jgi:hypothetical protein